MGTDEAKVKMEADAIDRKPADDRRKLKNYQRNRNNNANRPPKKEKFEGACADLKGHVFTAGSNRADQLRIYTNTMDKIKIYVGTNYLPLVLETIETMTDVNYVEPQVADIAADPNNMTKGEEIKYGKLLDRHLANAEKLDTQKKQTFSLIYGQCDEEIITSLEEHPDWKTIHQTKDLIGLLEGLERVSFRYGKISQEPVYSLFLAKRDFYRLKQQKHENVQEYYDRFEALKDVNESLGIRIHDDLGVLEIIAREKGTGVGALTSDELKEYQKEGQERMLAIHLLMGADDDRFKGARSRLKEDYLLNGQNNYPRTLLQCFNLLKGWSTERPRSDPAANKLGVAFNTVGDEEDHAEDGTALVNKGATKPYTGPPCDRCGRNNHTTSDCIAKTKSDGTVLHIEGWGIKEEEFNGINSERGPEIGF